MPLRGLYNRMTTPADRIDGRRRESRHGVRLRNSIRLPHERQKGKPPITVVRARGRTLEVNQNNPGDGMQIALSSVVLGKIRISWGLATEDGANRWLRSGQYACPGRLPDRRLGNQRWASAGLVRISPADSRLRVALNVRLPSAWSIQQAYACGGRQTNGTGRFGRRVVTTDGDAAVSRPPRR